jgi:uncharacterized membrane protein
VLTSRRHLRGRTTERSSSASSSTIAATSASGVAGHGESGEVAAAALTTWYGGGAVVSGWALSQRTLYLGRMNAPVNAVIGTTDPAVAVLLGVLVLGEHVASTPSDLVGEILSAAVVVAGTVVITRHSAAVLSDDRAGVPTPAWG